MRRTTKSRWLAGGALLAGLLALCVLHDVLHLAGAHRAALAFAIIGAALLGAVFVERWQALDRRAQRFADVEALAAQQRQIARRSEQQTADGLRALGYTDAEIAAMQVQQQNTERAMLNSASLRMAWMKENPDA